MSIVLSIKNATINAGELFRSVYQDVWYIDERN